MHANVNCLDNIASLSVAETEMRLLFNQDLHLTHANLREKCIKQTVVRTRLNASVRLFSPAHISSGAFAFQVCGGELQHV